MGAKRVPLITGIASKFQLRRSHAPLTNVSAAGDFAYLFDVTRGSPTFSVVAKTEIVPLSGKVARVIETPSALKDGGYLLALQPGVTPTDTTAR